MTDAKSNVRIQNLTCEYKTDPIGIDATPPRLSWQLHSERRNVRQSAYQIQVVGDLDDLVGGKNLLWDSGRVSSDRSIHQAYGGPDLQSGQRCYWRVRIWDETDEISPWSEPSYWEMGLLQSRDWDADWISPPPPEDPEVAGPSPMLRRPFTVADGVQSARLYITALGVYEAELNGRQVGDQVFAPGWTSYHERLQYQTYDVTDQLTEGENAIGVTLGNGWYRGEIGFHGPCNYGERLALLLQLQITYGDGRVETICSDADWKTSTGPILMAEFYHGENYDARLEKPGWSEAGFDDSDWDPVEVVEQSKEVLVAPAGPPVRRIQEIQPQEVSHAPDGTPIVDMGQNFVGWVRLRVQGPSGTTVTLRHGEVLEPDGSLHTVNLRTAAQTVRYTLNGEGEEIYEPHFTFQGFRYVEVSGYPGELSRDSLTGIVLHSDTPPTGHFDCSHPLINQLQHNIVWTQKGNFLEVPTDCPQRNERLGWTGDAQLFLRTASFNMNVAGFFTKWLRDLRADQQEDGSIPHVVPDVISMHSEKPRTAATAWSDAGVIVPWTTYLCYGDERLLAEQYQSMKDWVDYMRRQGEDEYLYNTGFHYGDWLAVPGADEKFPEIVTNKDLIATAYYAYSTSIVAEAARVLGKEENAETYATVREKIGEAFRREFVTPNGRVGSDSQTGYVLALAFGLLTEEQTSEAVRRLVADIRRRETHLSTGLLGTAYLCHVLSDNGHADVAYDLLIQESYPSWLYPVKQGATTIWERWNGIEPDGSLHDPGMNSFNHYALGAVGDWLYRVVAGIEVDPAQPGYQHILIQPQPGGNLTHARATYQSLHGEIESAWTRKNNVLQLDVTIPANTRATVSLPGAVLGKVKEGDRSLTAVGKQEQIEQKEGAVVLEIGSGRYRFTYDLS